MADTEVLTRGTFRFEVSAAGELLNSAGNVQSLRRLWLDRRRVQGEAIGPGDPGDFEYGAWHVACHLAGAAGVRQAADGRLLWLEISHDAGRDLYYASVTAKCALDACTCPLDSAEGRQLVAGSELLGFVEGNSTGRISARRAVDSPAVFNLWRRQDFDQPVGSDEDGGKVWEHWCTLRDLRPASRVGTSVLTAYVSLAANLGPRFTAAVARGRREYGHPQQLCAMIEAGLTTEEAATWETRPAAIPASALCGLSAADPLLAVEACEPMDWSDPPRYYMFPRRIDRWSDTAAVRRDLEEYRQKSAP